MDRLEEFKQWLISYRGVKEQTAKRYCGVIKGLSTELYEEKLIYGNLLEMCSVEIIIAINQIERDNYFRNKNSVGHRMYSSGLHHYKVFALTNELDKLEQQKTATTNKTEGETRSKTRIGQGKYRKELLQKYHQCVVTGIDTPILLIASHIKPWEVADDYERLDVNNGLLLSANIDKLFDHGLMTFENDGRMRISSMVGLNSSRLLGIEEGMVIDLKPTAALLRYMEYHRDMLFVK